MEATETPNALGSEQIIVGCMLTSKRSADIGLESLSPQDFYSPNNAMIFKSMAKCASKSRQLDVTSVSEELLAIDLKVIDGQSTVIYLAECCQKIYPSIDISTHIDIVREKKIRRDYIQVAQEIYHRASNLNEDLTDSLEISRQQLFKVDSSGSGDDGTELSELVPKKIKDIITSSEEYERTGIKAPHGISSGYMQLDEITNRFCDGHLVIIAARPGVGKTAIALNMIRHIALEQKKTAAFFSLEMSNDEIVQRMVSISSQVDFSAIKNNSLNASQRQILANEESKFETVKIVTYEDIGKTIADIRRKCRRLKERKGLDIVFIDYLQLIDGSGKKYENRQVEVADISRGLKAIAMDLKIPVVCLAQLSRRVEERAGGIPVLSDLRESGSVEQDADMVIFLSPVSNDPARKDQIAVHLAKNRHGQVGKVDFIFKGPTLTFQVNEYKSGY